jgi:hypothetical protein
MTRPCAGGQPRRLKKGQGPASLALKTRRREGVGRFVSEILAERDGNAAGIAGLRVMTPDGRRLFATQAVATETGTKVYLAMSRRDDEDEVDVMSADRLTLLAPWPQGSVRQAEPIEEPS